MYWSLTHVVVTASNISEVERRRANRGAVTQANRAAGVHAARSDPLQNTLSTRSPDEAVVVDARRHCKLVDFSRRDCKADPPQGQDNRRSIDSSEGSGPVALAAVDVGRHLVLMDLHDPGHACHVLKVPALPVSIPPGAQLGWRDHLEDNHRQIAASDHDVRNAGGAALLLGRRRSAASLGPAAIGVPAEPDRKCRSQARDDGSLLGRRSPLTDNQSINQLVAPCSAERTLVGRQEVDGCSRALSSLRRRHIALPRRWQPILESGRHLVVAHPASRSAGSSVPGRGIVFRRVV